MSMSSEEEPTENSEERQAHERAYQDILNPAHVLVLKRALETEAADPEDASNRKEHIETYLHIGDEKGDRPINDELRQELDKLLSLSYEDLEELIQKESETLGGQEVVVSDGGDHDYQGEVVDGEPVVEGDNPARPSISPPPQSPVAQPPRSYTPPPFSSPPLAPPPTTSLPPPTIPHPTTPFPDLSARIDEADKIISPYRRAKKLRGIAEENDSVEAAERILNSHRRRLNPLQLLRLPGSNKSEHDRALETITKKTNDQEAAKKIKRGNARNRAQSGLGKSVVVKNGPADAVDIAQDMSGARTSKWSAELVREVALSYNRSEIDIAVALVKQNVDSVIKRDKIFHDLAVKHNDSAILKEIWNPHVRSKARMSIS